MRVQSLYLLGSCTVNQGALPVFAGQHSESGALPVFAGQHSESVVLPVLAGVLYNEPGCITLFAG